MTDIAYLVLQNGTVFRGRTFGYPGETTGEVCFNTSMTGYQEILTDPSYCGQIVAMTYPHIGNYGVNPYDVESAGVQVSGFAVRDACDEPSNYRSTQSLASYLHENRIVGIRDIDTRALTRMLRDEGAMNGIISATERDTEKLLQRVRAVPSMGGLDLASRVTCERRYDWDSDAGKPRRFRVAALDFGIKHNILRLLASHDCDVSVLPASTSPEDILALKPDGLFLSNGPGDPGAVTYAVETVARLHGKLPIFGICLGHQILALSLGAKTWKMKFGHRGANHPVQHTDTGKVEISSQNHGFAVDADSLPEGVEPTHWNLNDQTLEGFRCRNIPAFSVQYHPEASPGPHDSRYLFTKFIELMESRA